MLQEIRIRVWTVPQRRWNDGIVDDGDLAGVGRMPTGNVWREELIDDVYRDLALSRRQARSDRHVERPRFAAFLRHYPLERLARFDPCCGDIVGPGSDPSIAGDQQVLELRVRLDLGGDV